MKRLVLIGENYLRLKLKSFPYGKRLFVLFARRASGAGMLLLALSCAARASDPHEERPYIVLVSFDGFRHDYVTRFGPPNFLRFIESGSSAEALIPSYPSKTFPNHYTIVTGLVPGRHGLVDNTFYDKKAGVRYTMGNRGVVEDPSFYGGVPFWQLVQEHGMRSASYFWVGSEVAVNGRHPDYYFRYDEKVANEARVEQVLRWLRLPKAERPNFISLYFSLVDTEGHNAGTQDERLKASVLSADSLLGRLMAGISEIPLPVNVVVVSDHGMTDIRRAPDSFIYVSKLFDIGHPGVQFANSGTHVHVYTSATDSLYAILREKESHFRAYRKRDLPAHWRYDHPRTGDLLLVAEPGFVFENTTIAFGPALKRAPVFGVHGYDPFSSTDMRGIFYAAGPSIRKGIRVPAFQNIHIYPFLAEILSLHPGSVDGDPKVLRRLLRKK